MIFCTYRTWKVRYPFPISHKGIHLGLNWGTIGRKVQYRIRRLSDERVITVDLITQTLYTLRELRCDSNVSDWTDYYIKRIVVAQYTFTLPTLVREIRELFFCTVF